MEQKAATDAQRAVKEINSGIYCFDSGEFWGHGYEIRPDNPASECYLTDMIEILNRAGLPVAATRISDPGEFIQAINDPGSACRLPIAFCAIVRPANSCSPVCRLRSLKRSRSIRT